ncbi:MAG: DTDP-4-dehydrorhamnose reductase [uncultured bacterium]|nr:MAG: DTDP-4-dehydrorhamnose reductase [uncultured bacterium]
MSKVLVLGSRGMLGQELVREFGEHNYEVIGWDKEELDITDFKTTEQKIVELMPDILINAVAYNLVDKIEEDAQIFELAKIINGEAVGNLARICRENSITLVHYSSDNVFKGNSRDGYKEDDKVDPVNKYGETKAIGENQLLNFGGKFYLIRLSKLFGKPAVSVGAKKSFVDQMIWLATEGGKTHLDLVDEEFSCVTYAPDLVKLTRQIIEDQRPFGIYHGSNSGVCSWYEWAKEIFKIKNIKIDITPVSGDKFPRPAKRPMYSELLNTKFSKQRHWEEVLKEYLSL